MSEPRALVVCADDYGLGPAVDAGILALAEAGRVSAVSCLTQVGDRARWAQAARPLRALALTQAGRLSVGLHFNLTEGAPASAELAAHWPTLPSLSRLIVAAHLQRLPLAAIAREWQQQCDRFADALGHAPHFVDGHQHVHHLPGVREIVLAAAQALGIAVRSTGHVLGPGHAFKRRVIEATGGRAMQRLLVERGLWHNTAMVGVHDFGPDALARQAPRWFANLRHVPAGPALLFCHPAASGPAAPGDAIMACRVQEAAYLGGPAFAQDLADAGLVASPFNAPRRAALASSPVW